MAIHVEVLTMTKAELDQAVLEWLANQGQATHQLAYVPNVENSTVTLKCGDLSNISDTTPVLDVMHDKKA